MIIITIGRNPENKIMINDHGQSVSGVHGEIRISADGQMTYTDTSRNGTIVSGRKILHGYTGVHRGEEIIFPNGYRLDWNQVPVFNVVPDLIKQISIGKSLENNIVLRGNSGSRYHALLKITKKKKYLLFDQSLNGVTINGTKIPKFTDVEIRRGDNVNFTASDTLDWTTVPGTKRSMAFVYVPGVILILLVSWFVISKGFETSVYSRYKSSVGLIYNSYYLAYVANGDTLYYIGSNGIADVRRDPSSIDTLRPYSTITGSGFFVSEDGKIITNKHVAIPWESGLKEDKQEIEKAINFFRLRTSDEISTGVKIVGVYVKLGVFLNNSQFDKNHPLKNLITCNFVRAAAEEEVDLAVIQVINKKLPQECVPVTKIISSSADLHEDEDVTAIGYPMGLELAIKNKENKIKATNNHGKVSKISDQYEVQYDLQSFHGASGSPVFNNDGTLIAVNYLGNEKVGGYNFGIIATHVKKLLAL